MHHIDLGTQDIYVDQESRTLPFIDMWGWRNPAPKRQWALRDRIPLRQPTLFTGKGGGGKTLLTLQLCIAAVISREWLGMLPEPGAAIYIGAEDEADELHRRVAGIAEHYGTTISALIEGGFRIASLAGRDAMIATPDRTGTIKPTPMFAELHRLACDVQPRLIVLDTVSDIFGGDENDRMQVSAFVGLLRKLAMDANAAVIVNSHPSQHGISTGSGTSGSTGWQSKGAVPDLPQTG